MTIKAKRDTLEEIRIKNPCIEKFIPLTIEKSQNAISKNIADITIDRPAEFYKAKIKLGDEEIGEFQTDYAAHCGTQSGSRNVIYTAKIPDTTKSFTTNAAIDLGHYYLYNYQKHFCKLVKEGEGYAFKYCDINGNIRGNNVFPFSSKLIDFNREYIKSLSDLEKREGSVYVIAKSKLCQKFNNTEDGLQICPIEIREYTKAENGAIKHGKLIGTVNHEYGMFRDSLGGEKSEFIFSDFITKGKEVRITSKDCEMNPEDECKVDPEGFLFLAKYRGYSDIPFRDFYDCRSFSNKYSESKVGDYVLGFANSKGCTKLISSTHLYEHIDPKKFFDDDKNNEYEMNKDYEMIDPSPQVKGDKSQDEVNYEGKIIYNPPRVPDMHDLWDLVHCAADPLSSGSMFL